MKRQAADSAQNVAETAKAEAANVAAEVKTNAKDLLYQAKSDLTDQAGAQQQKAAEGIRTISSELHSMADASDQPGVASDLDPPGRRAVPAVASWLEDRDPGSLLDEVKSFARQRPGTFLLLAAGAGVLAGRLGRSLQRRRPRNAPGGIESRRLASDTGMAGPRPPGRLLIAAGSGDRFFDDAGPSRHSGLRVRRSRCRPGTAADRARTLAGRCSAFPMLKTAGQR